MRAVSLGLSAAKPVALDADGWRTGVAMTAGDSAFCRSKANFHDRTLDRPGGNGRACADCHMASERFQLTPKAAAARLPAMNTTGIDDPLFRGIDAVPFALSAAPRVTSPT